MTYFTECQICHELFDEKGDEPKRLTRGEGDDEKSLVCCHKCYEKFKDGQDDIYRLLERK